MSKTMCCYLMSFIKLGKTVLFHPVYVHTLYFKITFMVTV